jgi:hypothetical protein
MKERKSKKRLDYTDEDFLPSLVDQMIDILDKFDFKYVADIMATNIRKNLEGQMVPWELFISNKKRIPTVEDLMNLAIKEMQAAIKADNPVYISRSGPFRVIKAYNRLILDFCLKTHSYD